MKIENGIFSFIPTLLPPLLHCAVSAVYSRLLGQFEIQRTGNDVCQIFRFDFVSTVGHD